MGDVDRGPSLPKRRTRRNTEKQKRLELQRRLSSGEVTPEQLGLVTPRRKRGRPRGYVVSDETKRRISETRRSKSKHGRSMPPHPEGMDPETLTGIVERDDDACVVCGARFLIDGRVNHAEHVRVHAFVGAVSDDIDGHALLCGFCSGNADALGARTRESLMRW